MFTERKGLASLSVIQIVASYSLVPPSFLAKAATSNRSNTLSTWPRHTRKKHQLACQFSDLLIVIVLVPVDSIVIMLILHKGSFCRLLASLPEQQEVQQRQPWYEAEKEKSGKIK